MGEPALLERAREGSDSMNRARSLPPQDADVSDLNRLRLVAHPAPDSHGSILSSWKEIANYLGKGVRTVQRWENELALPVHRPVPGSRRIVITTKEELAAWLVKQQTRAQAKKEPVSHSEIARMKRLVDDAVARAEKLRANAARLIEQFESARAKRDSQLERLRQMRNRSESLHEHALKSSDS